MKSFFIKRVSVWSFLLFVLYSLVVQFVEIPDNCGQNTGALRRIKAQQIIYSDHDFRLIVVGSSLTGRLPRTAYSSDTYNLSLGGDSANTGLELLVKEKIYPEILVIETNTLFISSNREFIEELYAQPYYTLRKFFPALREKQKPVNAFLAIVNSTVFPDQSHNNINTVDESILQRALEGYDKRNADPGFKKDFNEIIINRVKALVDHFQEKGTKVVFLEMPVHKIVRNSDRFTYVRGQLVKVFPVDRFDWIVPCKIREFEVSDGLHLLYREAVEVNKILFEFLLPDYKSE